MTLPATIDFQDTADAVWDVAIIGAGPAGSVAACVLARRGLRTLLIDRAQFPRGKVCGGCLNPNALTAFAVAGLGDVPVRLGAVPLRAVQLASGGRLARIAWPGGVSLSRDALDVELIREALKPIKILTIKVDAAKKIAKITVAEEDLSKAIGRRGQNVRLTDKLVGMQLIIDKDETAAEVFAAAVGSAAHTIAVALGIDEAIASRLVNGGFPELAMYAGASAEDFGDALRGDDELTPADAELATLVFTKAQALNSAE